ncbi:hypothetical protein CFC21_009114 [Triticum aestivum]|uniref:Uncharacterized protein n=3 Tax=Triticum TaxID=4564 RepID=A0A9R0VDD4_TRITD|nr:hypothetical protein CFC21_009114 [Triticum aestivum]VAH23107.1 unnamed protein product [Triticum turgidum subsp. durum]
MASAGEGTGIIIHARPLQDAASAGAGGGGGSYTAVFVVLGVIAALIVISCLVGQVCTKRHLRPRPRRDRVAYYDDDLEGGGYGHGHGVAKMEAAAPATVTAVVPAAASVEMRQVA